MIRSTSSECKRLIRITKTSNAPGKSFREGLSLMDVFAMFPDEGAATEWFERWVWPTGRACGKCGSLDTYEIASRKPMPYRCRDCQSYFSVRTGTAIERSKIPLRKWAIAIYLELTSLKSISSMKLHRDLKLTQKTTWFMLHRIRQAWAHESGQLFDGPVEVDETYMGGLRKNMPKHVRAQRLGSGPAGKSPVVGIKDRATNQIRAKHVVSASKENLHGFVTDNVDPDATIYTDEATVYRNLPFDHEVVNHSVGEYVRDMASTNGIESFWATLKRAHKGVFHKISPKHLDRYVREFAGKHNIRDMATIEQMRHVAAGLIGRRLMYRQLIAPNGLSSGAQEARV